MLHGQLAMALSDWLGIGMFAGMAADIVATRYGNGKSSDKIGRDTKSWL